MRACQRRGKGGDRGSATVSFVIIAVPAVLFFLTIAQGGVWYLAREAAIDAARQGADAARVYGAPPGAGPRAALVFARQAGPGYLLSPAATITVSNQRVQVTVTASVPVLVPGPWGQVSETAAGPVERFTP